VTALRAAGRRIWKSERGQAMVEFSIVAVVFMMMTFGIVELATFGQEWATIQHATLEGARYASTNQDDCTGITDNRTNCIISVTRAATAGIRGGNTVAVTVTMASWDYPTFATKISNSAGGACDAVEVTATYTHAMIVPLLTFAAPSGITLTGKKRTLVEPYATCGT
jgi:Flp pilus assembly protein TadG